MEYIKKFKISEEQTYSCITLCHALLMLAEKFSARANFNLHGDFSFRNKRIFQKKIKKNMSLHLGGQWILVEVNWLLFVQNNWLQTHHDCSERSKRKGSSFSSWTLKNKFLNLCSKVIFVLISNTSQIYSIIYAKFVKTL